MVALRPPRPAAGILRCLCSMDWSVIRAEINVGGFDRYEGEPPRREAEEALPQKVIKAMSADASRTVPPVSADARAMMMFEANKKSLPVSYGLWVLFGFLGGHRFYNERIGSAIAQLLLTIVDSSAWPG